MFFKETFQNFESSDWKFKFKVAICITHIEKIIQRSKINVCKKQ